MTNSATHHHLFAMIMQHKWWCVALFVISAFALVAPLTANDATPLFPHLAFTSNTSSLYISFFSRAAMKGKPTVQWGLAPKVYNYSAVGTSRSYAGIGFSYDVLVTRLSQKVRYFYRAGSEEDGWTPEYNFLLKDTAAKPTAASPVVVPFFGDMGITNSHSTIASLAALGKDVDFYYHVGDISYANDRHSDLYETVWTAWFQNMTNIMPFSPYMVLPGNHEAKSGAPLLPWSENFEVFNQRFRMPSDKGNNMWYSFNYKNIHFVSMSTETDFPGCEFPKYTFGDQLAWLEKDLAEANQPANRAARPWVIVSGHKPLYSSSEHVTKWMDAIQRAFDEVLYKYKVDIFFCGHVHAYERTWPVYKNKTVTHSYDKPNGIVVVTTGAAGDIEGLTRKWKSPIPDYSAHRYDEDTGYGVLTVESDKKLEWKFYKSRERRELDKFTLTK
eukprot:TRINITY_DN2011_c0_g1_i1.p1 TRINITY_DN2011_c0_g1~~TRINITY_DN2011_c0_g1_i1.p1  ORF type:complete len:443 (+),score=71.85 TRINITY_DN2011_c0_g1_i1:1274-2602(+)